ncbi:hypothetical protein Tco_0025256 [Tanacetum coccineum]
MGTIYMGTLVSMGLGFELKQHFDADHADALYTRKALLEGYSSFVIKLVSWKSRKHCTACLLQRQELRGVYLQVVTKTDFQLATCLRTPSVRIGFKYLVRKDWFEMFESSGNWRF